MGREINRKSIAAWLLPLMGFLALAIVTTPELFVSGFHLDERFLEYLPWRVEAARQLHAGYFPFFTDKVFGGMPLFATSYVGVLYPPNWLYLFFPLKVSQYLYAFHTFLGAAGMFVYLRSRRLLPMVAFTGGLLFACCTFFLSHGPHTAMREAGLLAPWVVWLARRLLGDPGPRRAVALAAAIAVQIAAGYQQMYLFTVLWVGVEWLESLHGRKALEQTGWLAGAGAAGTALMGLQILPSMAMLKFTARASMSLEEWQLSSFSPSHLVVFFSPSALGYSVGDYIGDPNPSELLATIPSFGWAFVVAGVVMLAASRRFRRGGRGWTFAVYTIAAAAAFVLALGANIPAYSALYHVPPFSLFRIPARYLYLMNVFGVVAGAMALQELMRMRGWKRLLILFACWMAWGGACLGGSVLFRNFPEGTGVADADFLHLAFLGRAVHAPQITLLLERHHLPSFGGVMEVNGIAVVLNLAAVLAVALPRRRPVILAAVLLAILALNQVILTKHAHYDPSDVSVFTDAGSNPLISASVSPPIERLYAFSIDNTAAPNEELPFMTFLYRGLRSLNGYCPLVSRSLMESLGMMSVGTVFQDAAYLENVAPLRQLGVSHLLVDRRRFSPGGDRVYAQEIGRVYTPIAWFDRKVLLRLNDARPRLDFARRWYPAGESDDPWELVAFVSRHDPAEAESPALLEDADPASLPPRDTTVEDALIRVRRDLPAYQSVDVDSTEGGVLLVRDVWWPGWRYKIENGGRVLKGRVRRANGVIRYVPLPPGKSVVQIWYTPPGWLAGCSLSLTSVVACLVLLFVEEPYRRRFRRRRVSVKELRARARKLLPWSGGM